MYPVRITGSRVMLREPGGGDGPALHKVGDARVSVGWHLPVPGLGHGAWGGRASESHASASPMMLHPCARLEGQLAAMTVWCVTDSADGDLRK